MRVELKRRRTIESTRKTKTPIMGGSIYVNYCGIQKITLGWL